MNLPTLRGAILSATMRQLRAEYPAARMAYLAYRARNILAEVTPTLQHANPVPTHLVRSIKERY